MNRINNSKGFTILEIVASIVILAIILFSFLSFFLQSKQMNVTSQNIVDETYEAQMTLENIFEYVVTAKSFPNIASHMNNATSEYTILPTDNQIVVKPINNPNIHISLTPFKESQDGSLVTVAGLVRVEVTVQQNKGPVTMESIWRFK